MKKLESSPKIIAKIGSATSVASSGVCNMCENYEAQLVAAQERSRDLEKQLCTLERYKEELSKETAFRKDMEEKWNEKKEEHKLQIISFCCLAYNDGILDKVQIKALCQTDSVQTMIPADASGNALHFPIRNHYF
ncbi:hypothetical protein BC332_34532 [Capsicum chinense]|nr:hypothetical protein BC332_34532 [Capsicum chinense]